MKALQRLSPGAHVVWLDQVWPMHRKDAFAVDAVIGMVKSTNHRFRVVTVFQRMAATEAELLPPPHGVDPQWWASLPIAEQHQMTELAKELGLQ
jgi:hypothetical protein